MKATITNCLAELVESKFGKDKWASVLSDSGLTSQGGIYRIPPSDIPDAEFHKLFASTCKVLGITSDQASDAFGEYWCCTYAPRMYGIIYKRFKNAREMIVGMDQVHIDMTKAIPNAQPPRFDYKWETTDVLVVTYKSKRKMIGVYAGLVRGVGKYFKEKLTVSRLSDEQIKIVFG
jgi:hypothetical protein